MPKQGIIIIGGGRWARVFLEVLLADLPEKYDITVYSRSNASAMRQWKEKRNYSNRLSVQSDLPEEFKPRPMAAFIINSAAQHAETLKIILGRKIPTFVEKPMSTSLAEAQSVKESAQIHNTYLEVSHVFRHARYLARFRELVPGEPLKISLVWNDPISEERHGERKAFDWTLPLYLDCMPHALSILNVLYPEKYFRYKELGFFRGGAALKIIGTVGKATCEIFLERNSGARRRKISITGQSTNCILDFSIEPGTIISDTMEHQADPEWPSAGRPVALMLRAFLNRVKDNTFFTEDMIAFDLFTHEVIDKIQQAYQAEFTIWLKAQIAGFMSTNSEDILYAIRELTGMECHEADVAQLLVVLPSELKTANASSENSEYTNLRSKIVSLFKEIN